MSVLNWIEEELDQLRADGLLREVDDGQLRATTESAARVAGVPFVDASSNDYLGLANLRAMAGSNATSAGADDGPNVSRETVLDVGECSESSVYLGASGAAASRLLGGTRPIHVELERCLALWVSQAEALLFSSGYAANVGTLAALAGPGDVIFSDALNHASIVDGCRLSRAKTVVVPHLSCTELEMALREAGRTARKFVVTESYFSMDGDSPDLALLRKLCDEHGAALVVDEAHALGVFGRKGAGIADEQGVVPDILIGTLGKAVGLHGAFVAGPKSLKSWLWNRARSFVYSTAMSPVLARELLFHVKHVQVCTAQRSLLCARVQRARAALTELQTLLPTGNHGPVLPIILGSPMAAIQAAETLRARGVLSFPVRPPTVPAGSSRLRLTLTAGASDAAFEHLLSSVTDLLKGTPTR
jgi:8-amino-7-oxononanoate synthase